MILRAKHHFIIYPFFTWYADYIIRKNFHSVRINVLNDLPAGPILLLSNHFSWWDGFFAMHVNKKLLHRKFHFMMLEEQLKKHWFFNYTGGFSVSRKKRSVIESIRYASGLLSGDNNLVLVFPQGRLQSMHLHEFRFEKGVERILGGREGKVQVLFLAVLTDWLSRKKPSAMIYLEKYNKNDFGITPINQSYNAFFRRAVEQQQNISEI